MTSWICVFSPLIYASLLIPIFGLTIIGIATLEGSFELISWKRKGDISAMILILTVGTLFFASASKYLLVREGSPTSWIKVHFRHCALLYLACAITGILLITEYSRLNAGLLYGHLVVLFFIELLGIGINIFFILRRQTA